MSLKSKFKIRYDRELPSLVGMRRAFNSLQAWRTEAKSRTSNNPPEFDGPLFLPESTRRSIFDVKRIRRDGQRFYEITVPGPTNQLHPRRFLPVHFAIMRSLELVPGVSMKMGDQTGRQDRKVGWERLDEERIYRINLRVGKWSTPLCRVLFRVPPNAELHERRNYDHRFVVPSAHVLTKLRRRVPPRTQDEVIDHIRNLIDVAKWRHFLPFNSNQMVSLLEDLFTISDAWHWKELADRLSSEKPRGFPIANHSVEAAE